MTSNGLSVRDLAVAFKDRGEWRQVTHGVSFDIAPRQTVALVGESGSGKSVTAMSIMRLLPPRQSRITGSIRLGGKELQDVSAKEMTALRGSRIGMIFQEPMTSLNPVMTTGQQISETLMAHRQLSRKEARAETIRLLDRVRIPAARKRFDEYPHQFSGGMRQRVMIAMALACKPGLLIADEPTTALDVTIQAQTIDLIKTLQEEEGMSVLFITHDMGVVAEVADQTVVMYQGRAVESGATPDIFERPEQPYTRALLSVVPKLGSMANEAQPRRFGIIDPVDGHLQEAAKSVDTLGRTPRPVLEVKDLVTRFPIQSSLMGKVVGHVHAVEKVSFTLSEGETLALVGESGCGKSTTGLSILQLLTTQSGSVKLDGEEINGISEKQMRSRRKSMQMIFQDPFASLNPRMNIGKTIAEPMLLHRLATPREIPERIAELLRRVGLTPEMARRYPHEFSGGQRQRICIARALAVEPRLIVADESVSALDVSIKAQIVNLLLDLQESMRLSYLFISHDMAVVERVSHRVAVMYLGEIVEIGTRAEIFANPHHPYTKRLLNAVPAADPSRRGRKHNIPDGEIKSAVRPVDYVAPVRAYQWLTSTHGVQQWGAEWD